MLHLDDRYYEAPDPDPDPDLPLLHLHDDDYATALPSLLSELRKQRGLCTIPILRLRLYYYYRTQLPAGSYPWTELWWLILDAIERGDLQRFADDDKWIHLPAADLNRLRAAYATRQPVAHRWRTEQSQAIGDFGEDVVRAAMRRAGFKNVRKIYVIHPGDGNQVEIDAHGYLPNGPGRPLTVASEVKNRTSEVLQAPTATMHSQALYQGLARGFEACRASGFLPIVFIPQVHSSAYGLLNQYGALACATLFQWIPDEQLARDIKKQFRFAHSLWVPDPDSPPKQVTLTIDAWFRRLQTLMASRGLV